ncbi:hypothetical protein CK203_032670 [Vitis vinifera]|uniref:Endonuclease/exonuclease/phosphatase domain-containing protein n=1 Tax=Vitis vinifera TaxID=29760 RepID=A0A438HXT2_VITVI|nr:hypothetical protein CK203_032670 [Vitis vinifera]
MPRKMVKVQSVLESLRIRIVRDNGKVWKERTRVLFSADKILSWNTRGLGSRKKRRTVRRFLSTQNPDVVMLQESKREIWDRRFVSSVWKGRSLEWAALPALYGPNKPLWRKDFWLELQDLYGLTFPRWCVGGDFKVIRRISEKMGDSRFENMWLLHPEFKEKFRDWWQECTVEGWEGDSWRIEGIDWAPISGESAVWLDRPFSEEEVLLGRYAKFYMKQSFGSQGAFVEGRQILDAILIANEVVDEKRDHVLQRKGFSQKWRSWMRGCLSSSSFAILVNGNAKGWVKASRGKWLWRFQERSGLWHKVIASIYGTHPNGWDANTVVRWSHRCPWKAIAQVFPGVLPFVRLVVGNGEKNSVLGRSFGGETKLCALNLLIFKQSYFCEKFTVSMSWQFLTTVLEF